MNFTQALIISTTEYYLIGKIIIAMINIMLIKQSAKGTYLINDVLILRREVDIEGQIEDVEEYNDDIEEW